MYKLLFVVAVLSCCGSIFCNDNDPPTVEVRQGKVLGTISKSRDGRKFFSFLGIPYGEAGRFQAPKLAAEWEGIFEATKYGPQCAQKLWVTFENVGEENCLHLQVFTPSLSYSLPVMVYFHGGGFTIGSGNILQPDYFMDEDVVLVLVNYRLGPFGFLSMQDEHLPGNNGLKDQNIALKWVQENISKFGGDPGKVTIFGNSAGGSSVSFHMLSPQSAGLFHAAIMQSGSALSPWAMSINPKEIVNRFGRNVGCPSESSTNLLRCLMTKTMDEILNATTLAQWGYDPFTPFGVVVEPDLPDAFMSVDPLVSLKSGNFNKVPVITGVTENEGILMHSAFVFKHPKMVQDLNEDWNNVLPITLEYDELYTNLSKDQQLVVSQKIRQFYFQDRDISEETRQELTNVYSDRLFNHGVSKNALLMAAHVPVYTYQFAHNRGDYSIVKFFDIDEIYGVSHADEVSFEFADSFLLAPEFQKGSIAEQVSKKFVKLWVSFAQNGSPTVLWGKQKIWNPITADERDGNVPLRYYRIDADTSIIDEPFTERINFWEKILTETDSLRENES